MCLKQRMFCKNGKVMEKNNACCCYKLIKLSSLPFLPLSSFLQFLWLTISDSLSLLSIILFTLNGNSTIGIDIVDWWME